MPNRIFVFGSNLAGRHGAGAARDAANYYGAQYGKAIGLQGQSYAIPTKDHNLKTLPLDEIKNYVNQFLSFAEARSDLLFLVTRIGCGLAGYTPEQIAPMFRNHSFNCILPDDFLIILKKELDAKQSEE